MPITAPTPITAAPPVPDSTTPEEQFDAEYEAFNAWEKNVLRPGVNALAENVFGNATDAVASATAADESASDASEAADAAVAAAAAAAATAGAAPFVSGQAYAQYAAAVSTIDLQTYRRKTAGASATDPSLDGANWEILGTDPDTLLPFNNPAALAQVQATALLF